jgi:hypothetical protein
LERSDPDPVATVRHRFSAGWDARVGMSAAINGVWIFSEPDYQYGVGPLRLRVERIDRANPTHYDGEDWYRVEGVQVSATGAELGRRHVLVRGRRLLR